MCPTSVPLDRWTVTGCPDECDYFKNFYGLINAYRPSLRQAPSARHEITGILCREYYDGVMQ